ncbi:Rid family hydrolase [Nibrella viscosa]|uniref:Rid family hydrolase n=1 Tax=Nibrella viscosa TaxID=1084524 RepID=A0ABP8KR14_9BACT
MHPNQQKGYGYTRAVRIGNTIRISGAVSLDDQGNPTSVGDMESQLKTIYGDLHQTLRHFGCTFDDVVVEHIYTTNMNLLKQYAGERARYYKTRYPLGSWLEVKQLAIPDVLVEIELEAEKR